MAKRFGIFTEINQTNLISGKKSIMTFNCEFWDQCQVSINLQSLVRQGMP
jgi:hypothetical protein